VSLDSLKKHYKKEFKESQHNLDYLINQPKEKIISWIYDQRHSWNLYSLSVTYLEFVSYLVDDLESHPFIQNFSLFLIQQTCLNCKKRENFSTFHHKWEELLYSITETEWNN